MKQFSNMYKNDGCHLVVQDETITQLVKIPFARDVHVIECLMFGRISCSLHVKDKLQQLCYKSLLVACQV